jgi:hypothetical protein
MNATPPGANTEYSRGVESLDTRSRPPASTDSARRGGLGAAVLGTGLLGAILLLAAEFATLFEVHTTVAGTVRSAQTGPHHGFALVPLAVLAAGLAYVVWAASSRAALIGIGALGILALLIALLADLPDASSTGLARVGGRYVAAVSAPRAGFYMETLGAVVLLITCVCGLVLTGGPGLRGIRPRRRTEVPPDGRDADIGNPASAVTGKGRYPS